MILHTIVPPEMIFPTQPEGYEAHISLTRDGIPMIVEQSGHMYKIIRIMSSDPMDYLKSDLHPGSLIPMI